MDTVLFERSFYLFVCDPQLCISSKENAAGLLLDGAPTRSEQFTDHSLQSGTIFRVFEYVLGNLEEPPLILDDVLEQQLRQEKYSITELTNIRDVTSVTYAGILGDRRETMSRSCKPP